MENNVDAQNVYWRTPKASTGDRRSCEFLYAVCVWYWLPPATPNVRQNTLATAMLVARDNAAC